MNRIDLLKEYLLKSPGDSFLLHALALEYVKIGDDGEARKLFEEILNKDAGYVGTYYHLAQLLERAGETSLAIDWYQRGMAAAKQAGEQHAYNELQAAYEDLIF